MNRRKFIGTLSAFMGLCATAIGVKSKFAPLPIEEYRLVMFPEFPVSKLLEHRAKALADSFAELDEIEAKSPIWRFIDGEWNTHEPENLGHEPTTIL